MIQDVRFALRMIRKRPTTSSVVVLTLSLGIAANAVFFSSFYGMVLCPLPFDEPERLVNLTESQPALDRWWTSVSAPNLEDWRHDSRVLEGAAAYRWADFNLQSDDDPESVEGAVVEAGLFPLLGVGPIHGRHFLPSEDVPGGPRVVLLGHGLWTRLFAGDPAIVGRTVRLNGEMHEVVGIMPEGFRFQNDGQLWTPLGLGTGGPREARRLAVIARLADGVSVEQAQQVLSAVAVRLAEAHPASNRGWDVHVRPLREAWLPPITQLASAAQMVLVLGILLIVCANVVNVVLAQASARRQETALRAALGAGRGRLLRQSLAESLVLAAIAGVLGLILGAWGNSWIISLVAIPIPYWIEMGLNAQGIAYITAVTLAAGVLIGLAPALRGPGARFFEALKSGGRTEEASRGRLRRILVVAEYAVALVILVAGLLMVKSFANLADADPGFDTADVLTLKTSTKGREWEDPARRLSFLAEARRQVDALAGVEAAAVTSRLPISREGSRATRLAAAGRVYPEGEEPQSTIQAVSTGYFETLGIPVTRGRAFTEAEGEAGTPVAVLSESLASLLWKGSEAVGREIRVPFGDEEEIFEVIGVAGDVEPGQMIAGLEPSFGYQLYVPLAAGEGIGAVATLVARTPAGRATEVVPDVRRALRSVDASVPVFDVFTMEEVLKQFYFAQHIWSRMFAAIALLALVIAAVGVYGVTVYSVSQRRREMGIRLALGASPGRLLRLVLHQGLALASTGIVLGLLGAVPLARLMEGLLHDMKALDPGVFLGVVGLLVAVGIAASYLPGRRAAGTDPLLALRDE